MCAAVLTLLSLLATTVGAGELDASRIYMTMLPMSKARIEAIDWKRAEMTLSHAHLYEVNRPAGTTAFPVRDTALLDLAQVGDPVYVVVDRVGEQATLLSLTPRHPE